MLSTLKNHFGYDEFRPLQEEIINNVLAGKDSLVIMPTGGGKSLCYQLPALRLPGVTLVISPLISLMKDQVDGLQANGVPSAFINSSLTYQEIARVQHKAQNGRIKILYIAPERLAVGSFSEFLGSIEVSLIAIDEAHCISEWGHDFRPEYRNLKRIRKEFSEIPVIALTATATLKVQKDIIEQLGLESAELFTRSFDRENLSYAVRPKQGVFDEMTDLLKKYKDQSAIIYCSSRRTTEKLAEDLRDEGFNARPYHAGLDQEKRTRTQEKFIRDEISVIVATIAFGMGIDKPDVRLVIHYDLPKSLEGYYQETGRAGRDGLPSECVLFYSYGDKRKQDYFIRQISNDSERLLAEQKLDQVIEFCELNHCRRAYLLNYFGEKRESKNCGNCDTCLAPVKYFSGYRRVETPAQRRPVRKKLSKITAQADLPYDKTLFNELRILRKELADERNVPPFVIFSDVSLRQMAHYYPKSPANFGKINGVGDYKLSQYGARFMEIISTYALKHGKDEIGVPVKVTSWAGGRGN